MSTAETTAQNVGELSALSLHPVDLGIIIVYFTAVLSIGLWIGRNTKGGDDLFLAGRSLGWVAIGFSLFASNISSTTLIGNDLQDSVITAVKSQERSVNPTDRPWITQLPITPSPSSRMPHNRSRWFQPDDSM